MSPAFTDEEQRHYEQVRDRLVTEFEGLLPPETVSQIVEDTLARWHEATVTMHIPVLAQRLARERLRHLADHGSNAQAS